MHPITQAFWATVFTWAMTALGAAVVFLLRSFNRKVLDTMQGFAAGVMIAASYWSLLAPAIEMSADLPLPIWVPATVGFVLGGVFLWGIDRVLPHLHIGYPRSQAEGIPTDWQRSVLLVSATGCMPCGRCSLDRQRARAVSWEGRGQVPGIRLAYRCMPQCGASHESCPLRCLLRSAAWPRQRRCCRRVPHGWCWLYGQTQASGSPLYDACGGVRRL